jgi:hypothetical protein
MAGLLSRGRLVMAFGTLEARSVSGVFSGSSIVGHRNPSREMVRNGRYLVPDKPFAITRLMNP